MNKKYYIAPVFGGTDPETLIGPYKTFKGMLKKAKKVKENQRMEDSIFWLVINDIPGVPPAVCAFTNHDLEIS
jgi:hypothetical protein